MTKDETKQILMRIDVAFPSWKPKDLALLVEVWQETFADYPYQVVLMAVKSFIQSDRQGFAPSIGQIMGLIVDISNMSKGEELTEMEAWALVGKALRNSAYNAKEEFDKLPANVQRAVGSPENLKAWGTDPNYNENVAQSHFMNVYRTVCQRDQQIQSMPKEVKALIGRATDNPKLLTKEDYD